MDLQQLEYDVFLSYSSKDKPTVQELAERLKQDGSRTLVLVMSKNAFTSEWMTLERQTALFRDPTNQQRRFIPLRLDDSNIKDSLKQFAYLKNGPNHCNQGRSSIWK
jgi:hypothetical protein